MPCPSKLRTILQAHGVDDGTMRQIYDGFEDIGDKSPKKAKTAFFRHAMQVLDANLPYDRRREIMDDGACCLHGSREQKVKDFLKSIAGQDLTLAEKVEKLRQARPFYNSTRLTAEDTIIDGGYWQTDGKYQCSCTCFTGEKLDAPISSTYCLCCAGHYRHHLQNALSLKLRTKRVISSPLASMGSEPCLFEFEVVK